MENKQNENCAYCKSEKLNVWQKLGKDIKTKHFVYCKTCGCEGPTAESEAEAIDAWNRRYSPLKNEEELAIL